MKRSKSDRAQATDLKMIFGRRVRECRQHAGLSQEELAELANLDRTYVSSIERGKRNVSLENICRLAAALRLDPADLMKGLRRQKGAVDGH